MELNAKLAARGREKADSKRHEVMNLKGTKGRDEKWRSKEKKLGEEGEKGKKGELGLILHNQQAPHIWKSSLPIMSKWNSPALKKKKQKTTRENRQISRQITERKGKMKIRRLVP